MERRHSKPPAVTDGHKRHSRPRCRHATPLRSIARAQPCRNSSPASDAYRLPGFRASPSPAASCPRCPGDRLPARRRVRKSVPTRSCRSARSNATRGAYRLARCQIRLSQTNAIACTRAAALARAAPPGLGRADSRSTRPACGTREPAATARPTERSRLTPLPFMLPSFAGAAR